MPHSSPFDWGGETGDPWPLLTEFQTGGLSNAKIDGSYLKIDGSYLSSQTSSKRQPL
jgi:hypothetical protein